MSIVLCHLLLDDIQFTLIHGPNIPGSYAILFFTASDFTSITSHIHNWALFCFGSVSVFFPKLFLHWFPVPYWAPTNLGSSLFSVLSFCLFTLLMAFSRQEYWSGLPFPSTVDRILSACLFNLHAEYIMRNAWLEEAQAGIKMPGEIAITLHMQMTPPLWQKVKRN